VTVYDCKQTQTLPGTPIGSPARSKDGTVKRAFKETKSVAKFYKNNHGLLVDIQGTRSIYIPKLCH
jgi:hypothetical protein